MDNDLTLQAASALKLGFVTEAEFDRVVDPAKMVRPYVRASQLMEAFMCTPIPVRIRR
jgi:fumarate hydratase class II